MLGGVDAVRVGKSIRALRRRRGWRQADLASAARVSSSTVSRLECGGLDGLTLETLESLAAALGARIDLRLLWNGEALDRLLDAAHADLVEDVAALLRRAGWDVAVEVTFNVRGERGSVDVLAFESHSRTVLVVEVKSVVPDLQATLSALDRKTRLARDIAAERAWRPSSVGRLLVIAASRTARRRVEEHAATFRAAFPARSHAVAAWLRSPAGDSRFSGLLFLPNHREAGVRHRMPAPRRSATHRSVPAD